MEREWVPVLRWHGSRSQEIVLEKLRAEGMWRVTRRGQQVVTDLSSLTGELCLKLSNSVSACPGCSYEVKDLDANGVGTCVGCGGLVSTRALSSWLMVQQYVRPRGGSADPAVRYFDLRYWPEDRLRGSGEPSRTHGWLDAEGRVVQWG